MPKDQQGHVGILAFGSLIRDPGPEIGPWSTPVSKMEESISQYGPETIGGHSKRHAIRIALTVLCCYKETSATFDFVNEK